MGARSDALTELAEKGLRFAHSQALDLGMFEPAAADIAQPGDSIRWHQVALEGSWDGHWQGPFSLERRDFEQMVQQFHALSNDTIVDYEHNSLSFFAEKNPAAGWITDMDIRQTPQGVGLFARISWTESAERMIRAREYRYVSPTILWRTTDRKTGTDLGTSLHSVALTNTPFLDELPEVTLNSALIAALRVKPTAQAGEEERMNKDQMASLCALLGLHAEAAPEVIMSQITDLKATAGKAADDARGLERICGALGMEGASVDAMVATARALRDDNDTLSAKAAKADELSADAAVRQATEQGKITADNREWASTLARENPEMFASWAAHAPAVVPMDKRTTPKAAPKVSATTGPSEHEIERLCQIEEIQQEHSAAAATGFKGDVQRYVKINFASLQSQYV
jgi:phage I-like protein